MIHMIYHGLCIVISLVENCDICGGWLNGTNGKKAYDPINLCQIGSLFAFEALFRSGLQFEGLHWYTEMV